MRPYPLRQLTLLVLVVLALAACGDSAGDAAETTLAPATTTTAATTTTTSTTTQPPATPLEGPRILENGDFETGDLTGWTMETFRDGEWLVYEDGLTPPDPKYSPPDSEGIGFEGKPFELPDPPQGRYAAVTDSSWAGAGVRYLYRDIEVTEPYVLHALVFYQNSWTAIRDPGHFNLTDEKQTQWYHNQQYRVDVIDPTAPIDTVEPDHIWGTLFATKPGDPGDLEPTRVSLDLSPWQGETVRLRLVCVSHIYGPMRAGVDDVDVRVSS
jgi:hypothetical protein